MSDVKDIKGFQDQIVDDCVAISKALKGMFGVIYKYELKVREICMLYYERISSVGRALGIALRGHGFESHILLFFFSHISHVLL